MMCWWQHHGTVCPVPQGGPLQPLARPAAWAATRHQHTQRRGHSIRRTFCCRNSCSTSAAHRWRATRVGGSCGGSGRSGASATASFRKSSVGSAAIAAFLQAQKSGFQGVARQPRWSAEGPCGSDMHGLVWPRAFGTGDNKAEHPLIGRAQDAWSVTTHRWPAAMVLV
jgi:hypothetical protein